MTGNRWHILLLTVVTLWMLTQIEKSKTHMSGEEISRHGTNYTDNEYEQNAFWHVIPTVL